MLTTRAIPLQAGSWRRRRIAAPALAAAALLAGAVFYLGARPPGSTLVSLPVSGTAPWWPFAGSLPYVDALPSLLHAFAFSLLTAAAIGIDRRAAWLAPPAWLLIDGAFEWLQLPGARAWFEASPIPWMGGWLRAGRGSFDPLDLLGLVFGAGIAAIVISRLRCSTHGDSRHVIR